MQSAPLYVVGVSLTGFTDSSAQLMLLSSEFSRRMSNDATNMPL